MNKLKTISDAMLPMKALNWFMGCGGIIEYPLGNSYITISFLYSSACAITYCLMAYITGYYNITQELGNTEHIFYKFFFYLNLVIVPETIFMGWKCGKELKIVIQRIEKVDELLRKLKISDEYVKLHKKQIFLMAFTATTITILITVNWNFAEYICHTCIFGMKLIFVLKFMYPRAITFIGDFTFIGYTLCLRRKFKQLNDVLKGMSGTSYLYPQYMKVINFKTGMNERKSYKLGKKTNHDTQIIKIAKKAHLDLVKISKHINRIFGLQLLISMTYGPILIIYLIYNAFTVYTYSHDEKVKFNSNITMMSAVLFYGVRIFAVNHICEETSYEARKTGSIICELHEPAANREFRLEVREFTLQLIQNPLKFTAFGFVTLDHTFIQGVVATITTYLVILIQLRDMSEGN